MLANLTGTIHLTWGSVGAVPPGGVRIYYNPDITSGTIDPKTNPAISIGLGDMVVSNAGKTYSYTLPGRFPQIYCAGSGSMTFKVAAIDAAGQEGPLSSAATLTVTAPTQAAPTVT